jgi:transcriptional regulator with XRE-family HTH domain
MKADKKRRLEAAGWKVGTAAEFLELSPADQAFIEIKLQLAKKLRELRADAELTQKQVAKQIGSSQSRVAKMEAGDPTVSLDLLVRSLLTVGSTRRELATVFAGPKTKGSKSGQRAAKPKKGARLRSAKRTVKKTGSRKLKKSKKG